MWSLSKSKEVKCLGGRDVALILYYEQQKMFPFLPSTKRMKEIWVEHRMRTSIPDSKRSSRKSISTSWSWKWEKVIAIFTSFQGGSHVHTGKKRKVRTITSLLLSKALQGVKTRYPNMEKLAVAFVISLQKLWPFQSHSIEILTNVSLK